MRDRQRARQPRRNPTGCLHDLQSAITTTFATPPGGTPHDTGQTMAFFNMQNGDVPFFKFLADNYTMSDNYHQPVMGGTWADSMPLGFADQVFFSDGHGNAVTPPATTIYNPDPLARYAESLHVTQAVVQLLRCDAAGNVKPILDYLGKLPYAVQTKCDRWPLLSRREHQSRPGRRKGTAKPGQAPFRRSP